jgi:uncharacterized protein (DUF1501 family)
MKRRQFIQTGSLVSLPILLGGLEISAMSRSSLFGIMGSDNDRVLVLIQLNGGNDGLNMVIPLDQYSGLNAARPTLVIPENKVLRLNEKTGLHPSMTGLQRLFAEEKLAVVQSVGYPNQNRSHFRSTDIWTSASAADEYISTGWMGRYFDTQFPGFPEAYPNADYPDPFAITLGNLVSETCQGSLANYSFSLTGESSVRLVEETVAAPPDSSCYSQELAFIKTTIQQSNAYASKVLSSFDKGNNQAIYHANQVLIGEPENGAHATLLQTISDAVTAFTDDCAQLGIQDRVVGMTFSEFGRQIKANNSYGTDHGTAAPLFVFGHCVHKGIFGDNPDISREIAPQEGVPMQYDFRSVYASLLIDWLGAKDEDVRTSLFQDFQKIPFVRDCASPSSTDNIVHEISATLAPNPCQGETLLSFEHRGGYLRIDLMDALGSLLKTLSASQWELGTHKISVSLHDYPAGSYFLRLTAGNSVKTLKCIKIG